MYNKIIAITSFYIKKYCSGKRKHFWGLTRQFREHSDVLRLMNSFVTFSASFQYLGKKNPRPSKKSKLGVNVSLTLKKQSRFQGQRIHFQLRYMVKKSKLIKRKEIRVVTQPICEKRARLAITFHASRRNVDLCISRAKDDDWCTSITHFLDEECF